MFTTLGTIVDVNFSACAKFRLNFTQVLIVSSRLPIIYSIRFLELLLKGKCVVTVQD